MIEVIRRLMDYPEYNNDTRWEKFATRLPKVCKQILDELENKTEDGKVCVGEEWWGVTKSGGGKWRDVLTVPIRRPMIVVTALSVDSPITVIYCHQRTANKVVIETLRCLSESLLLNQSLDCPAF